MHVIEGEGREGGVCDVQYKQKIINRATKHIFETAKGSFALFYQAYTNYTLYAQVFECKILCNNDR